MKLVAIHADGQQESVAAREFRVSVQGGWWLKVKLASYAHIPLVIWLDLGRDEPFQEWGSKPGPRLALLGDFGHELLVETTGFAWVDESSHWSVTVAGPAGFQAPFAHRALVATVADQYDVRLCFEPGANAEPRVRIAGPPPRSPADGSEGQALVPACMPRSPFQLSIDFHVFTVSRLR